MAAGTHGSYLLASGLSMYGGVMLSRRYHRLGLQGGVSKLDGRNLYRLGVDYTHLAVGNQACLNLTALVSQWQYQNDHFNRYSLSLQYADQTYKNIDTYLDKDKTTKVSSGADVRDSRLVNLAASWTRSFVQVWNPVFASALNVGDDKNRKEHPDLSRSIWGARAAITVQPFFKWTFGGGLSYQNSLYASD